MKQIDYETAINQLMVAGNEEIQIAVLTPMKDVMPLEIRRMANEGAVFFIPDNQEAGNPPPSKPSAKRRQVDGGKIKALHEAGWPVAKIADEMRVSQQTVYTYLKKMEEKERVNENKQTGD